MADVKEIEQQLSEFKTLFDKKDLKKCESLLSKLKVRIV